jgi:predicted phosphodiesterase
MFFGHTHIPYHRVFEYRKEGKPAYFHAINIGSVGKREDGGPCGCYVILTVNENTTKLDKESIHAEFIRFEYDIEKAAKAIEQSILPDEYAEMLRKEK